MNHFTRMAITIGSIAFVCFGPMPGRNYDVVYTQSTPPLPGPGGSGVAKGDFNGDGVGDLAIGEPNLDIKLTTFTTIDPGPPPIVQGSTRLVPDAGAVHIILGSTDNGLTAASHDYVDQGINKNDNNHFGAAVVAGKFNADNFSDLAVGVPGATNSNGDKVGAIYVFNGSSSGLPINANKVFLASQFSASDTVIGNATLKFPENMSMTWGDFNGDGFGDLAVEVVTGSNSLSAWIVIPGSLNGLTSNGARAFVVDDGLSENNFPNPPPPPGQPAQCHRLVFCAESRGHITLAAGKLHSAADAFDDLVIGDPGCTEIDDQGDGVGPGGAEGCVIIIQGRSSGLSRFQWRVLLPGGDARRRFGAALAIGDFDGDTHNDLAVGAPDTTGPGAVRIFEGPNTGVIGSQSGTTISIQMTQDTIGLDPSEAGDEFGAALAASDFDGDGTADLAIGIPGETIGTKADAGAVMVIHGSLNGLEAAPGLNHPGALFLTEDTPGIANSTSAGDRFGSALTAFNFGRTAQADLAIGVPFDDVVFASNGFLFSMPQAGAVHVLYGAQGAGLTMTGIQFWSDLSFGNQLQADAHFGAAIY